MEKKMEKEKNIIKMNYYSKENIKMEKDGMEKENSMMILVV